MAAVGAGIIGEFVFVFVFQLSTLSTTAEEKTSGEMLMCPKVFTNFFLPMSYISHLLSQVSVLSFTLSHMFMEDMV